MTTKKTPPDDQPQQVGMEAAGADEPVDDAFPRTFPHPLG
jgi:hypothetical protein